MIPCRLRDLVNDCELVKVALKEQQFPLADLIAGFTRFNLRFESREGVVSHWKVSNPDGPGRGYGTIDLPLGEDQVYHFKFTELLNKELDELRARNLAERAGGHPVQLLNQVEMQLFVHGFHGERRYDVEYRPIGTVHLARATHRPGHPPKASLPLKQRGFQSFSHGDTVGVRLSLQSNMNLTRLTILEFFVNNYPPKIVELGLMFAEGLRAERFVMGVRLRHSSGSIVSEVLADPAPCELRYC